MECRDMFIISPSFLPLSDDKILIMFKLKALADDKLNVT